MEDIAIIIPAYKPDKKIMMEFINKVKKFFIHIIIINDGSGKEYSDFFENLKKQGIVVLTHYINLGKGRAIKTAFNYVLNNYKDIIGTITADCDGQHYIEDIIKCANRLKQEPDKLIIGTRNFNEKQVPFKSRYGNKITRAIFATFVGIKVTDTQSGLRGFGKDIMKQFLQTAGERYEYETNMLIECKEKNINIEEIPISTIYIQNNSLSHFNVIKDSLMIYKLFIKYIITALSSFILDILLFTLLVNILPQINIGIITKIVIASIIARVISSTYNFLMNSNIVFKNMNKNSIIKYFILATLQMLISAFGVSEIFKLININSSLIKIILDTIIFIVNFIIQREWVFKEGNRNKEIKLALKQKNIKNKIDINF